MTYLSVVAANFAADYMERQFVYIINPISGTKGKKELQQIVEQKTEQAGFSYQVFPSVANGDYSFLDDFIRENKVTDVIIAGGDGTVGQVVNGLHKTKVNFGIIPCGSGNGLAFTAGIPKQPAKALDIIFKGNAVPVDAFTINGQLACMLSGLGFDAKVAHDFAQQPTRGLMTYMQQTIKNFVSAKTYSFGFKTGRKKWETEAYWVSIANSNQFGNNFKIAPAASLSDGLLDIVVMASPNKFDVIFQTLKQVGGFYNLQNLSDINTNKSLIYFQTENITILNKSLAPLHIDGDPAETTESFTIEVKKHFFKLIQKK